MRRLVSHEFAIPLWPASNWDAPPLAYPGRSSGGFQPLAAARISVRQRLNYDTSPRPSPRSRRRGRRISSSVLPHTTSATGPRLHELLRPHFHLLFAVAARAMPGEKRLHGLGQFLRDLRGQPRRRKATHAPKQQPCERREVRQAAKGMSRRFQRRTDPAAQGDSCNLCVTGAIGE